MKPMSARPAVVFYVSGHGFGHASREVEIINALASTRPDVDIVLRSAVSPSLLDRTLRAPVLRLEGPCDVGVVQIDSVTHDDDATIRQAVAFQAGMPARIVAERARLASLNVQAIVGDIPPLAFDVAATLGVPSVAVSNFTWDWIYEWYTEPLQQAPGLLEAIRASYRTATHALELPLAGGFEVFPQVTPIPFVARHAIHSRDETRRRLGIEGAKRVALLSFGGYGLERLDVSRLDCLKDWTLLVTDRILPASAVESESVRFVPESTFESGLRYEDLVAAVDVVVTKPGYGIVSECVAHDTPMLYTSRGRFREYDLMVAQMPAMLRCRFLPPEDLFEGRWQEGLEGVLRQPAPVHRVRTDGAGVAAAFLSRVLDGCSTPASTSSAD
jgi:hypothetical protein